MFNDTPGSRSDFMKRNRAYERTIIGLAIVYIGYAKESMLSALGGHPFKNLYYFFKDYGQLYGNYDFLWVGERLLGDSFDYSGYYPFARSKEIFFGSGKFFP